MKKPFYGFPFRVYFDMVFKASYFIPFCDDFIEVFNSSLSILSVLQLERVTNSLISIYEKTAKASRSN